MPAPRSRRTPAVRLFLACVLGACLAIPATAATINVTTTGDTIAVDSVCSLREAIQNANANAAVNVDCAAGSGADTIALTGFAPFTYNAMRLSGTQLPVITESLTIQGGPYSGPIESGGQSRVFEIASPGNVPIDVTLSNLGMNGYLPDGSGASGGAILSRGANLNIVNCSIGGRADVSGGAIQFFGDHGATFTVTGTTFSGEATNGSGGALDLRNVSTAVTLTDSSIGSFPLVIVAGTVGAGVNASLDAGGSLVVTRCQFIMSVAGKVRGFAGSGGGLNVTSSTPGSLVTIQDSAFQANGAEYDEYYGRTPILEVGVGGAIAASNVNMTLRRCFIGYNRASRGAAIAASASQLLLENVTILGNESKSRAQPGTGTGALYLTGGSTADVRATTFYQNPADTGGASVTAAAGSTLTLYNSIVASMTSESTAPQDVDAGGVPVAANYSLFGTQGTQAFIGTGNIFDADPKLVTAGRAWQLPPRYVGENAWPALLPSCGSVVIDRGDPAFALPGPDGRGKARVVNGRVDIGATEFRPSVVTFAQPSPINEAGGGVISVNRTGDSPVSATVTCGGGTATNGVDYRCSTDPLTWAVGDETPKLVTVTTINDTLSEANETFAASLATTSACASVGPPVVATIVDDDPLPSLSINSPSAPEGQSGTSVLEFTVTLTPASGQTVTVNYATVNATAAAGSDYVATSGTLTFAPGVTTQTIPVTIIGDRRNEPNETFRVVLSSPVAATLATGSGTGTIVDDDPLPVLTIDSPSRAEGNAGTSILEFTVTLTPASTDTVTATYETADGTAIQGTDYTATRGTLTFAPGVTTLKIPVTILGDTMNERDETFAVFLSAPAAIVNGRGTGTILNDDPLPVLAIDSPSRPEGDVGSALLEFTVTLTPASGQRVTVNYATVSGSATAGSDFNATSGTLTFNPGVTTLKIPVTILGDTTFEPDETFMVVLSSPTTATLAKGDGTGTILNDDPEPVDLAVSAGFRSGVAFVGAPATYDITIRNAGASTANAVVVTDSLPAGATFLSATPSSGNCSGTKVVVCSLGALPGGAVATVAIRLQPAAEGPLANSVTVSAAPQPDLQPANDSASANVTVQPASAIPTLSEWAKLLLAVAIASIAVMRLRG